VHWTERTRNILISLTVLHWAWLTVVRTEISGVVLCFALLHCTVALLVCMRLPADTEASNTAILLSLPGVAVGAVIFLLTPDLNTWSTLPQVVISVGCVVTLFSMSFLGRSFAILPALRKVVIKGPYGLVRHPIYVGELIILLGCALTLPFWTMLLVMIVAVLLVALRILVEERTLNQENLYQTYASKVKFRLLPYVW
jgi:protein-S-isoprenylcysteine O-methyltransferase Ste14